MIAASRERLAAELVLLALVAYLSALLVTTAVRAVVWEPPVPPANADAAPPAASGPAPLADYAVISERDVFNPAPGAPARARGTLRLWGVALTGQDARAVIEDTATHR